MLSSTSRSPVLLYTFCLFSSLSLPVTLQPLHTLKLTPISLSNPKPPSSLPPTTSSITNTRYPLPPLHFLQLAKRMCSRFDDQFFSKERRGFYRAPYYALALSFVSFYKGTNLSLTFRRLFYAKSSHRFLCCFPRPFTILIFWELKSIFNLCSHFFYWLIQFSLY